MRWALSFLGMDNHLVESDSFLLSLRFGEAQIARAGWEKAGLAQGIPKGFLLSM